MKDKVKSKLEAIQWNKRLASHEYTERRLTFGMHTGRCIRDLPTDYLKWGILNLNEQWASYFARELQRREPRWRRMGEIDVVKHQWVDAKDLGI